MIATQKNALQRISPFHGIHWWSIPYVVWVLSVIQQDVQIRDDSHSSSDSLSLVQLIFTAEVMICINQL